MPAPKPSNPLKVRGVEAFYTSALRKVAAHVGMIVNTFDPINEPATLQTIVSILSHYSHTLEPWARATASRMIEEVHRRDYQSWLRMSKTMSRSLREELLNAPTGQTTRELLSQQISLIKSLPVETAERVQKLALEARVNGKRPSELAKQIAESGNVAKSRATLIARTEISRAGSALTQARAQYAGSPGYIWRGVKDAAERPSHRRMEGVFVPWDQPPILDGLRGHAGTLPNCRCFCFPVLPE